MPTWENEGAMSSTCTQAWAAANPGSKAHAQRAGRVLPGGVTHDVRRAAPFPLAVARADGAQKWDANRNVIICDGMNNGTKATKHSNNQAAEAVQHHATVPVSP